MRLLTASELWRFRELGELPGGYADELAKAKAKAKAKDPKVEIPPTK